MKINLFPWRYFIAALFLLALPFVVQAQFTYVTNSDGSSITITGYNGPGGGVIIPEIINNHLVADVANGAFTYNTNITSVTFTNSFGYHTILISIGASAFMGCSGLTSVFLGNTVTNIEDFAFADCTNLTSVYFGGNAPPDVGTAFYGDLNAVVYYEPGTTGWGATFGGAPTVAEPPASEFNYTYNSPYDGSITITEYRGPGGTLAIPSYINGYLVTSIGFGAFQNSSVTNVIIPDSVTNIGEEAFADSGLINITIPNSVISIGEGAFAPCGLTSIIIPNSITSIGDFTFQGCPYLTSITIPVGITNIGDAAFEYCSSLTNVTIPDSVTSIGNSSFAYCSGMTGVAIPGSVTSIGQGAFAVCTNLASVTIPNSVTNIADVAFEYCSSLTNVTIPDSVTSIGDSAFYFCTSLTSITIPNSVTNIGYEAFNYSGLITITIPRSVTSIGGNAFLYCTHLTSAYFEGNNPTDNRTTFIGDPATVYYLPGTLGWPTTNGNNPTKLWYQPQPAVLSFEPSFGVQNKQFGFTISWATNASMIVQACTNLANPNWIPIATNLLNNGTNYFSDAQWKNYPCRFYRVSGLALPPVQTQFIFITNNNTITITGYTGAGGAVVIPETINGYTVTSIGPAAFEGSGLTSVNIPDSVTSIEPYAFFFSKSLTSVTIPGSVTSIGADVFYRCGSLTNVTMLNGVTSIGETMFFECTSLASVTIPNSVTNIGVGAFQNCTNLNTVAIPENVTSIGENAFNSCTSLTNISVAAANPAYSSTNGILFDKAYDTLVQYPAGLTSSAFTIPNSVINIGYAAFVNCASLASITIPGSITSIAEYAFYGGGLTSITMPASATSIGDYAFENCTNLTSAYFEGNAPPDDGTIFNGDSSAVVYYLPGTTGWGGTFGAAPTVLWYQPQPTVLAFETSFGVQNQQFGFTISWATNASVIVQACTNLSNPNWIPVATNFLSNGTNYFSDPQWTNYPSRFYRVSGP